MCGIVGYSGSKEAKEILLDGLHRLEYRGYDSAGVCVMRTHDGAVESMCVKANGRVRELEKKLENINSSGTTGIAHTRWATHGEPSEENAHPHGGQEGIVHIVHNGIIENYAVLKKELEAQGHAFRSDTDSEVVAHLIEQEHKDRSLEDAVYAVIPKLSGAYGIVAVSSTEPDTLVAVKKSSPLVLGVGDGEYILASDAAAIVRHTKNVIYLQDDEIVVIKNGEGGGYEIKNLRGKIQQKDVVALDWSAEEAQKGGYPHFTLKEIMQQPHSLRDTLRGRISLESSKIRLGGLSSIKDRLRQAKKIIIVSCGTSFYAGQVGKMMMEEYADIPVEVEYASEFRYRTTLVDNFSVVIAISQSGETADTLAAVEEAKNRGALTIGIVNTVGSTIARTTDAGIYNHVGPEIGVASTKAFTSQLCLLTILGVLIGRQRRMSQVLEERIVKELAKIPDHVDSILKQADHIRTIAQWALPYDDYLFLGRKYNFPIAYEGALKIKEIAYVHAEGYPTGELKHGPIALIDSDFPCLFIAPVDSVYEKNKSGIEEIKARGGKTIVVTTEGNEEMKSIADHVMYIPKTLEVLSPILSVIPLQLYAYYSAVERGLDVDKPRNLAKSVTVE